MCASTCVLQQQFFVCLYAADCVFKQTREKAEQREREVKKSVPPYNSKTLLRGVNFFIDQKVFTF